MNSAFWKHDFLQAYGVQPPWRSSLGVLVLAATFALICGIWVHSRAWVVFAGAMLLLLLGVAWPLLSLWGLRGSLRFGRLKATEGQKVRVSVRLTNRWPWAIYGLSLGEGILQENQAESTHSVVRLGPWESAEVSWEFVPPVRGRYPQRQPEVRCGFPFGLWTAAKRLQGENTLLVRPKVLNLPPLPEQAGQHRLQGQQLREVAGDVGDVLGTRPYRQGDSVRKVHWPLTARYDRMIVCERQSLSGTKYQIIPDLDPQVHQGSGANSSREWAIRWVASLTARALLQNAHVETTLDGKTYRGESMLLPTVLDALARLSDEGRPLEELLGKAPTTTQLIVTTDRRMAGAVEKGLFHPLRYFLVLNTEGTEPVVAHERLMVIEPALQLPLVLFPKKVVSYVA